MLLLPPVPPPAKTKAVHGTIYAVAGVPNARPGVPEAQAEPTEAFPNLSYAFPGVLYALPGVLYAFPRANLDALGVPRAASTCPELWALAYLCGVNVPAICRRLLVLAAAAPLWAACSSPNKPIAEGRPPSPASAAEMALMARHDSLMAQLDQLYNLKKRIAAAHAPAAGPYLRGLAAADATMFGWMHQYHAPDSAVAPTSRLAYFRQQQQVLAGVHQQFRATIDSATLFIKSLPAPSPSAASTPSR